MCIRDRVNVLGSTHQFELTESTLAPAGVSLGPMALDTIRAAVAALQSDIAAGPITPNVTPEEIRNYLTSRYDFKKTVPLDEVVADVERMLHTWQVQVTHPRYFGLFNPSVTLASIVADTLAAMYNPQLATWRTSPAANEIERHTLAWLAAKFGFPANAIATFTTGGCLLYTSEPETDIFEGMNLLRTLIETIVQGCPDPRRN